MTTLNTLPASFGPHWVNAMLTTVLGTAELNGAAETLGDFDRRSGDGDFGTNLTSAFNRVRDEIAETGPQTYASWLTAVSRGFLGTGGTSGPLFGMLFRDLARCAGAETPTSAELSNGLNAALATVQRYGKAEVGHKTMVDAIAPAATALAESAAAGAVPAEALDAAAVAAQNGALGTRDIIARRGRASYVGEVSRGVLDPGAVAAALMVRCAAGAARGIDDAADVSWAR
ncbi:dihydroxyacetone kinase subunit L [Mycolicibacterium sp.]|uniref:dihydroxyacetone kinase subunit L n=1 Tax=Mycolicibacterium sp. TaxID=2320850 RepID=UPI0037CB7FE8